MTTMSNKNAGPAEANDAARAADLLVTVAQTLNERLAVTAQSSPAASPCCARLPTSS